MTNGRGAGMASFMSKKKKYKFQVDVVVEDLLEVPFVSAVLFAKLRLLDGGSFQDHSTRQEVKDHAVKWGSKFSFPCKMFANASTCVLERCILRISVRKECKGGRSFTKLGFVDINLAEYAGAGEISKKALLEGYDARHRQDNSMLKFSIKMHMLSGDILFKVPSPAPKHKQIGNEDNNADTRTLDDFSSSSLGGSTASGSSGFGSLPKKRPQLLNSDLVKGPSLIENNVPITISTEDSPAQINQDQQQDEGHCEQGHSRNSSNTSQMSKASGYSSIHSHSHSRQSSSGDSGHIRKPKRIPTTCFIPTTHPEIPSPLNTPENKKTFSPNGLNCSNLSNYATPKNYNSQTSQISTDNSDDYRTPDDTLDSNWLDNSFDLQKSFSLDPVKFEKMYNRKSDGDKTNLNELGVLRSASEIQISRNRNFMNIEKFVEKSDNLFSLLTPIQKRKKLTLANNQQQNGIVVHSTPKSDEFKVPKAPSPPRYTGLCQNNRTSSLNSLRFGNQTENWSCNGQGMKRGMSHRKLLEGQQGPKLAPVITSPDDQQPPVITSECAQSSSTVRRTSVTANPSSSSLVLSETGSLDRAKAALEKRKKVVGQNPEENVQTTGRVEETRVNPNHLIEELLKNTNLEPTDDSAENSGLQLFIAKDGTASLGNHEVKSQMSTGHHFKQVVMEDKR